MADFSRFRRSLPPGARLAMERAADGWPIRAFRWPADRAGGSLLFLGGRGDIIEKYLESFAHWHARGWSVTAFDWRGQGGSGRFTADPLVGHAPNFSTWIDDLASFAARWRSEGAGPHIAVGHSMGGHLILRGLAEKRVEVDGAVLVAPMLGFETGLVPLKLAATLVGLAARLAPTRFAWKSNERPGAGKTLRQSFLTSDRSRYEDELWWKAETPELALGPPSFNWLAQAYRSCLELETRLENVTTPLLLLGTEGDRLVSPGAIVRAAAKLPDARLKMFDSSVAHEILRERDGPRDDALAAIDRFLSGIKARA